MTISLIRVHYSLDHKGLTKATVHAIEEACSNPGRFQLIALETYLKDYDNFKEYYSMPYDELYKICGPEGGF